MSLSAVLLAGGKSRRMGLDKATVNFRGEPMWLRQIECLRQTGVEEILISARSDPAWRPVGTTFVADTPPSRGPLSGLAAALAAMRGSHLLVLAVDMPLMKPFVLKRMSENIGPGRGLLPTIAAQAEPLAAIYPRESLPIVLQMLTTDSFVMRRLAENLTAAGLLAVFQVPETDVEFYRSLNNPADLQSFSRQHVLSSNAQSMTQTNV
jgi:molybdenum cofactor guanylyltransferase